MKLLTLVFIFVASFCSIAIAQRDSAENENTTKVSVEKPLEEKQKTDANPKPVDKNYNGFQRQPQFLITPDRKIIIDPRRQYPQFAGDELAIPNLGFPSSQNPRQTILLTDNNRQYNLELSNFQQQYPSDFQTALGAISAHVINQKTNQEYIPYPPNGNPYNYPAYRGHPRATEPPVVRAYERASKSNYNVQPVNFDQQNLRSFYAPNDYQQGFGDRFQNYYDNTDLYNNGFYSELRRNSDPFYDPRYNQRDEYLGFARNR